MLDYKTAKTKSKENGMMLSISPGFYFILAFVFLALVGGANRETVANMTALASCEILLILAIRWP